MFTPPVVQALNGFTWWAVTLFVLIAGVELDLREAWRFRRESGIAALPARMKSVVARSR